MNLANNLIYIRKKLKKSQTDIANLIGVKTKTYAAWEQNISEPNHDKIIKLSNVLQVSIDYLVKKDLSNYTESEQVKENFFIAKYNTSSPNIKQAIDLLLN